MRLALSTIALAAWAVPALAAGPSFDCAKAATIDERLICASPELSGIDADLAEAVRIAARARVGVLPAQRQWVSERNRRCGLSLGPDETKLDRDAATLCLYRAYEDRRQLVRANGPTWDEPARPTRIPTLPKLAVNREPRLCASFEAAEQDAFRSLTTHFSAIGRPWPGTRLEWIITPARQAPSTVTLDDGRTSMAVALSSSMLASQEIFAVRLFATEADVWASESRADVKRTDLLPNGYDWSVPGVFALSGNLYILQEAIEGRIWQRPQTATLWRAHSDGHLDVVCQVRRLPDALEPPQAVAELAATLRRMAGQEGACGSLHAATRQALTGDMALAHALLRPWATNPEPYNSRAQVDAALAAWSSLGVWNRAIYAEYETALPQATQALAADYAERFDFSQAQANQEARRVIDLLIRSHFIFAADAKAADAPPLVRALLSGAPVTKVRSLLPRALDRPAWPIPAGDADYEDDDPSHNAESALFFAVRHPQLVELLLKAGASAGRVNFFGKTPLMYAAQFDELASARLLLAAGAKVGARTRAIYRCNRAIATGDRTALHYAAENAGLELIRLLVEAGADVTARTSGSGERSGQTPLDFLDRNTNLTEAGRVEAERLLGKGR